MLPSPDTPADALIACGGNVDHETGSGAPEKATGSRLLSVPLAGSKRLIPPVWITSACEPLPNATVRTDAPPRLTVLTAFAEFRSTTDSPAEETSDVADAA